MDPRPRPHRRLALRGGALRAPRARGLRGPGLRGPRAQVPARQRPPRDRAALPERRPRGGGGTRGGGACRARVGIPRGRGGARGARRGDPRADGGPRGGAARHGPARGEGHPAHPAPRRPVAGVLPAHPVRCARAWRGCAGGRARPRAHARATHGRHRVRRRVLLPQGHPGAPGGRPRRREPRGHPGRALAPKDPGGTRRGRRCGA
mmetsp:Transcript_15373/g.51887  ORF Transcript_15373/g.51887 Transcript_15373/m.51887 type:complete len:206 (+) Transcript_15373:1327-1944(+)